MKKIIALALALIMALSMASVAFAAGPYNNTATTDTDVVGSFAPGAKITITNTAFAAKGSLKGYKVSTDFTTGSKGFKGASYIDDVVIVKDKNAVELTLKESYTLTDAKQIVGQISLTAPKATTPAYVWNVIIELNNNTEDVVPAKKASAAEPITAGDKVQVMDEEKGGYITFTQNQLTGTVKVAAKDKVYLNFVDLATFNEDSYDALMEVLGEDFDGITEMYSFETKAAADVDFRYDAYEEDDHFFYIWDGEKLTAIDAKYDADEDVDDYVFTADAANTIVITDTEVVLAAEEETKNPDTGANDVVGVAAALAVVSLVAAGAVSLKK